MLKLINCSYWNNTTIYAKQMYNFQVHEQIFKKPSFSKGGSCYKPALVSWMFLFRMSWNFLFTWSADGSKSSLANNLLTMSFKSFAILCFNNASIKISLFSKKNLTSSSQSLLVHGRSLGFLSLDDIFFTVFRLLNYALFLPFYQQFFSTSLTLTKNLGIFMNFNQGYFVTRALLSRWAADWVYGISPRTCDIYIYIYRSRPQSANLWSGIQKISMLQIFEVRLIKHL